MEPTESSRIVMLGAGNLAWHLGPGLQNAGYNICQVFSRTEKSAAELGARMGVEWTSDPDMINPDADILIFCVSDSALEGLFCNLELRKKVMMIHTSGGLPAGVFKGIVKEYGVLYPVMTFSKERAVDFIAVPICIEGSSEQSSAILEDMAGRLSGRVYHLDSDQRRILHLAATIACNFSNHMYHLSKDILDRGEMDFELLRPLILETAVKAIKYEPGSMQTGPAVRKDNKIMHEHTELLKDEPGLQKIYTFVSDSIIKHAISK